MGKKEQSTDTVGSAGESEAEVGLKAPGVHMFLYSLIEQEFTLGSIHKRRQLVQITVNAETQFLQLNSAVALAAASYYHQLLPVCELSSAVFHRCLH